MEYTPDTKTSPAAPDSHHVPRANSPRHELASFLAVVASALIFAVLLIAFVFQAYTVDGPSMKETLHNGDRLIVLKVPRTWARITGNTYIPKRGDIIVFNSTGITDPDPFIKKQLIKRVIGLPGERVIVQSGKVTVVSNEYPGGFNPDTLWDDESTVLTPTQRDVDLVVPKDHLFVMGDNRGESEDSRYFGTITAESIVGVLAARILPINQMRGF